MSAFAKLAWQCRRGTLELDLLLRRYLDTHYLDADAAEQQSFQALLDLEDDKLLGLLLGEQQAETLALRRLIQKLRSSA